MAIGLFVMAAFAQSVEYDIFAEDKVIGSCKIEMSKRGGGYFIRKTGEITDAQGHRTVAEEMVVTANWFPEDYSLQATSPEGETTLRGSFSDTGVELSGKLGMGEIMQTLESGERLSVWSELICMSSALILLPRVDYTVTGQPFEFPVVIPEKMELGSVILTTTRQEGDEYIVHGGVPGGWEFDVWFDPSKNMISKYGLKGGYEVRLTSDRVKPGIDAKPPGYNPLTEMILDDSDFIERLGRVKHLTSNMSMSFPAEAAERLYLNSFSQEFAGEITSEIASGSVEVKKIGHKVTNTPDWPLYYPLKGVEDFYTMPERGIDSDDPNIKSRAEKTVNPALTLWDAARAINLWVYRNIEYSETMGGAKETFESLEGNSRSKALLCVAMCRAMDIPARIVQGVLYAEGPTDHAWVEVYLGEIAGWGPLDPTLGEADKINATHISLWLGTTLPPIFAKDIDFENTVLED